MGMGSSDSPISTGNPVILNEQPDLLGQIGAEQIGPRHRGLVRAGAGDEAVGEAGIEPRMSGRGDAHERISGTHARVEAARLAHKLRNDGAGSRYCARRSPAAGRQRLHASVKASVAISFGDRASWTMFISTWLRQCGEIRLDQPRNCRPDRPAVSSAYGRSGPPTARPHYPAVAAAALLSYLTASRARSSAG